MNACIRITVVLRFLRLPSSMSGHKYNEKVGRRTREAIVICNPRTVSYIQDTGGSFLPLTKRTLRQPKSLTLHTQSQNTMNIYLNRRPS